MIDVLLWLPLAVGAVGLFLPKRLVGWWALLGAVATLGVAAGSPVLVMDRILFALDGRRIEWRVRYCHFAGGGYYLATME